MENSLFNENNKQQPWKLYIDDLRTPPDDSYIIARSVEEAQILIQKIGMPNFISFDHDLGMDETENLLPTGYDFAKWLVDMDLDEIFTIPSDFGFQVHSQNPVGARNIQTYLDSYMDQKNANDSTIIKNFTRSCTRN